MLVESQQQAQKTSPIVRARCGRDGGITAAER